MLDSWCGCKTLCLIYIWDPSFRVDLRMSERLKPKSLWQLFRVEGPRNKIF